MTSLVFFIWNVCHKNTFYNGKSFSQFYILQLVLLSAIRSRVVAFTYKTHCLILHTITPGDEWPASFLIRLHLRPSHHLLCSVITIPNYTSPAIGSKFRETRLLLPLLFSIGGAAQVVFWRTTRLNSSRRSCKSSSFSSLLLKTTSFLKKALIVKLSCSRIRWDLYMWIVCSWSC